MSMRYISEPSADGSVWCKMFGAFIYCKSPCSACSFARGGYDRTTAQIKDIPAIARKEGEKL